MFNGFLRASAVKIRHIPFTTLLSSITSIHFGQPPTGRKMDITAITIIQFANGQLVHGWNNWDQLGMMQQLGLVPGPVDMDRLLEKPA